MTVAVLKAEEWPDLWEQTQASFRSLWPEYNHHGDLAGQYFSIVFPRYAKLQLLLYDEQLDRVIGRGRTIPFRWDGTAADLPRGIDELGMRAVQDDRAPTALAALAAEVVPDRSGQGLSRVLIESMVEVAAAAGLGPLVAPVRPSWKDRYPIDGVPG
jgi:GNAT superfamily N-acetyltransferase